MNRQYAAYTVTFGSGSLGLSFCECDSKKGAFVDGFPRNLDSSPSIAENMGTIRIGSRLLTVNGTNVSSALFDKAIDAVEKSKRPVILEFADIHLDLTFCQVASDPKKCAHLIKFMSSLESSEMAKLTLWMEIDSFRMQCPFLRHSTKIDQLKRIMSKYFIEENHSLSLKRHIPLDMQYEAKNTISRSINFMSIQHEEDNDDNRCPSLETALLDISAWIEADLDMNSFRIFKNSHFYSIMNATLDGLPVFRKASPIDLWGYDVMSLFNHTNSLITSRNIPVFASNNDDLLISVFYVFACKNRRHAALLCLRLLSRTLSRIMLTISPETFKKQSEIKLFNPLFDACAVSDAHCSRLLLQPKIQASLIRCAISCMSVYCQNCTGRDDSYDIPQLKSFMQNCSVWLNYNPSCQVDFASNVMELDHTRMCYLGLNIDSPNRFLEECGKEDDCWLTLDDANKLFIGLVDLHDDIVREIAIELFREFLHSEAFQSLLWHIDRAIESVRDCKIPDADTVLVKKYLDVSSAAPSVDPIFGIDDFCDASQSISDLRTCDGHAVVCCQLLDRRLSALIGGLGKHLRSNLILSIRRSNFPRGFSTHTAHSSQFQLFSDLTDTFESESVSHQSSSSRAGTMIDPSDLFDDGLHRRGNNGDEKVWTIEFSGKPYMLIGAELKPLPIVADTKISSEKIVGGELKDGRQVYFDVEVDREYAKMTPQSSDIGNMNLGFTRDLVYATLEGRMFHETTHFNIIPCQFSRSLNANSTTVFPRNLTAGLPADKLFTFVTDNGSGNEKRRLYGAMLTSNKFIKFDLDEIVTDPAVKPLSELESTMSPQVTEPQPSVSAFRKLFGGSSQSPIVEVKTAKPPSEPVIQVTPTKQKSSSSLFSFLKRQPKEAEPVVTQIDNDIMEPMAQVSNNVSSFINDLEQKLGETVDSIVASASEASNPTEPSSITLMSDTLSSFIEQVVGPDTDSPHSEGDNDEVKSEGFSSDPGTDNSKSDTAASFHQVESGSLPVVDENSSKKITVEGLVVCGTCIVSNQPHLMKLKQKLSKYAKIHKKRPFRQDLATLQNNKSAVVKDADTMAPCYIIDQIGLEIWNELTQPTVELCNDTEITNCHEPSCVPTNGDSISLLWTKLNPMTSRTLMREWGLCDCTSTNETHKFWSVCGPELVYHPCPSYFPAIDGDLTFVRKCFSSLNLATIFNCLLIESKILFLSSDVTNLTTVCQVLMDFISPLQWQHPLCTILPLQAAKQIMQCPTPFFIGMMKQEEECDINCTIDRDLDHFCSMLNVGNDVLVFDVDHDRLRLPHRITASLVLSSMSRLISRLNTCRHENFGNCNNVMSVNDHKLDKDVDAEFVNAFRMYMREMLSGISDCVWVLPSKHDVPPTVVMDEDMFCKFKQKAIKTYELFLPTPGLLEEIIKTQALSSVIAESWRGCLC